MLLYIILKHYTQQSVQRSTAPCKPEGTAPWHLHLSTVPVQVLPKNVWATHVLWFESSIHRLENMVGYVLWGEGRKKMSYICQPRVPSILATLQSLANINEALCFMQCILCSLLCCDYYLNSKYVSLWRQSFIPVAQNLHPDFCHYLAIFTKFCSIS